MTRDEFKNRFSETLSLMFKTMSEKNNDYASDDNPFGNFTLVKELWITSIEKWILVRIADKISRISNLIDKEAKVKDESIKDTLLDLANYAIILKIYLENKE